MPLTQGKSHEAISSNIAELVKAGHPQKQAEAIAYAVARRNGAKDDAAALAPNSGVPAALPRKARDAAHSRGNIRRLIRSLVEFFDEEENEDDEADIPAGDALSDEAWAELSKDASPDKLSEKTRAEIGTVGSSKRQELPESDFLEPGAKKYPVKKDGKYDRKLLIAAASEARMHGHEELAKKADAIREREFGSAADMAMDWRGTASLLTVAEDMAFDRETSRRYDADGRLHLDTSNISKANVCEYLGREIPDYEALGLDPGKKYKLLRHPDELKKAVGTFNNLPILSEHVPVSADSHKPELVIGSTGTDAEFNDPYLTNSLVFWSRDALNDIEGETKKELSSAYRYRADMTPGEYEGESYDGVMRDLVGNHLALVREGRAGPDVVVGDSADMIGDSNRSYSMSNIKLSRAAIMVKGAIIAKFPKLATDEKSVDAILDGVTGKNFKARKPVVALAIKGLAQDAEMKDVAAMLDALKSAEGSDDMPENIEPGDKARDADPMAKVKEDLTRLLSGKISAEEMAKVHEALGELGAMDETEEERAKREEEDRRKEGEDEAAHEARVKANMDRRAADKKAKDAEPVKQPEVTKAAMDAAIKAAVDAAVPAAEKRAIDATIKAQREIRDAEKFIRPWVGELAIACDSADEVHRAALTTLGVDTTGIHPSAFKKLLEAQPLPGSKKQVPAMDSAGAKSFSERFPGASRIQTV